MQSMLAPFHDHPPRTILPFHAHPLRTMLPFHAHPSRTTLPQRTRRMLPTLLRLLLFSALVLVWMAPVAAAVMQQIPIAGASLVYLDGADWQASGRPHRVEAAFNCTPGLDFNPKASGLRPTPVACVIYKYIYSPCAPPLPPPSPCLPFMLSLYVHVYVCSVSMYLFVWHVCTYA